MQHNKSVNNKSGVYDAIDSEELDVYEDVDNDILGIREVAGNGELALIVNNLFNNQHNAITRDIHGIHDPVAHNDQPVTVKNDLLTNSQCVARRRYVLV